MSTQPTTNIRAHEALSKRPSIDASFSGCWFVTSIAMLAPNTKTFRTANRMKTGRAAFMFALAKSTWRFLMRYQALTLHIRAAPTVHDAAQTWSSRGMNDGVNTTSTKLVMTARLSTIS